MQFVCVCMCMCAGAPTGFVRVANRKINVILDNVGNQNMRKEVIIVYYSYVVKVSIRAYNSLMSCRIGCYFLMMYPILFGLGVSRERAAVFVFSFQ